MTATTKRRQAENVISVPQVQNALRRLTAFQVGPYRVVSCYLKLEPRDRERTKYQIKLKNRIRLISRPLRSLASSVNTRRRCDRTWTAYWTTCAGRTISLARKASRSSSVRR